MYSTALIDQRNSNIIDLSFSEIDVVGGAGLYWSNQNTDWAEVGIWAAGGAIAGARGGGWGIALGAIGGGGAAYFSQHVHWN